jgi:hypothetical protein
VTPTQKDQSPTCPDPVVATDVHNNMSTPPQKDEPLTLPVTLITFGTAGTKDVTPTLSVYTEVGQ